MSQDARWPSSRTARVLRRTAALGIVVALTVAVSACTSSEDSASTTTVATGSPDGNGVKLTKIADIPQAIVVAPRSGTDDLYVGEKAGRVWRLPMDDQGDPTGEPEVVLDVSGSVDATEAELGFLGATFSPAGDKLYVSYTDIDWNSHVDEYLMNGDEVDADSRREILYLEQVDVPHHRGGTLAFGPDGYLYFGLGDGGDFASGQDLSNLRAKILRIDPTASGDQIYTIPSDNPFLGDPTLRPEIWLYGVRNPWHWSFDRETGDLWIGDVGQNAIEEVNLLAATDGEGAGKGANLGWSVMEGDQEFELGTEGTTTSAPGTPDPLEGDTLPVYFYEHASGNINGCAVIGGYVYRGERIPDLEGTYIFGDQCQSDIRAIVVEDGEVTDEPELDLALPPFTLLSFGEDNNGELYALAGMSVLDEGQDDPDGGVYRFDPA